MNIISYDQREFPLAETVAEIIGVFDLSALQAGPAIVTRKTDQGSPWHPTFYAAFPRMRELYEAFVQHVAMGQVDGPYCFQAVPTFRVQVPRNFAVGEFHRDSDYNHPDGEVNFWVPLTETDATTSVWIEPAPGEQPEPVVVQPGQVLIFDAVNQRHGNVINSSGKTRVSFDFRCLPMSLHRETDAATLNTGLRFQIGGYYRTLELS